MAVKKGLGKGLDSLITDKVNTKPAASKNNPIVSSGCSEAIVLYSRSVYDVHAPSDFSSPYCLASVRNAQIGSRRNHFPDAIRRPEYLFHLLQYGSCDGNVGASVQDNRPRNLSLNYKVFKLKIIRVYFAELLKA